MRNRTISIALILVLLLGLLTGCSSKEGKNSAQTTSLHVVIATPYATEEHAEALREALLAAVPELDSADAPLSVTAVSTGDTAGDPMGAMAGMTKVSAMMMSHEMELLLCDSDNARRHGDNGETYIPLSELFTESEIAELGISPATLPLLDDMANYTGEYSAPCGIDLSGNATVSQMLAIPDPSAYVIVDSPNLENAKAAIKALLNM